MLTPLQIDIIEFLSLSICGGLIIGGFTGMFAGAFIRINRTRHAAALLSGPFLALLPSITIVIAVTLILAIPEMLLSDRGHKGGLLVVPDWAAWIHLTLIFIAGIVGAFYSQRLPTAPLRPSRLVLWTFIGALIGAIASLGLSFDGYFVMESNARPIRYALTGFAIGGITVLLLRILTKYCFETPNPPPDPALSNLKSPI